ncbi:MAG: glycerophosphodiester phosphodiesterase [Rhodospirillales bacterium]
MNADHHLEPNAVLPKVIGHRGAAGHAPENTLSGLRKAHELGVSWVEFDVMLTAEGTPVLIHDETLERTTNGTGHLADRRWEDLRDLDAGTWFGPAFRGERVPSLHQALSVLGHLGLGANVEIKPSADQDATTGVITAKTLQESWPANLPAPLLSSFSEKALAAAADRAPEFPRALLVGKVPENWQARCDALGATGLHAGAKHLSEAQARGVIDAGYALRVYTVNDQATADRLFAWGVESVFSDYPDRITPP